VDAVAGKAPLCNVTQEFVCGAKALEDYVTSEDGIARCDCPARCFTRSYGVSISQAVFSDYILDYIA